MNFKVKHLLLIQCVLFCFIGADDSGVSRVVTQDQTSTRPNTLFDDADDIQRQLDNEARDRYKFGRPKSIWVLHLPTQFPELNTATLPRNPCVNCRRAKFKANRKSKIPFAGITASRIKDWNYAGQNKWSEQYPDCGGRSQSPIDLPTQGLIKSRAGRRLIFKNYDSMPKSLIVRDNGKRLILFGSWNRGERPLIYGGAAHSRRYIFHSLTMHWPSEHTVGGFLYPMESQVIHISAEYRSLSDAIAASPRDPLAILGVSNIFMFGNTTEGSVEEFLSSRTNPGIGDTFIATRPLSAFSPPFKKYVAYQGSLTAPPCTESVLWMVRARSLSLTRATGAMAGSLLAPGGELRRTLNRQTQPRNDRKIYYFT